MFKYLKVILHVNQADKRHSHDIYGLRLSNIKIIIPEISQDKYASGLIPYQDNYT